MLLKYCIRHFYFLCILLPLLLLFIQGYTIVRVAILDRNDKKPVFNPINYAFEVSEGLGSSGLSIAKVMATDMDEGDNAKIVYKIRSGNIGNAFAIHPETVRCIQMLFKYTTMTLLK